MDFQFGLFNRTAFVYLWYQVVSNHTITLQVMRQTVEPIIYHFSNTDTYSIIKQQHSCTSLNEAPEALVAQSEQNYNYFNKHL